MKYFRANGKLLLSGEYFVLDGALALGLPTKLGQRMTVTTDMSGGQILHWQSYTVNHECWFEALFDTNELSIQKTTDNKVATLLQKMLRFAKAKNVAFLEKNQNHQVSTYLEFPRIYGLGSSSTLICLIAKWAAINPFELLFSTMKGSGYDIACGMTNSALTYQLVQQQPQFEPVSFNPPFSSNIYFIHLNQKQNSRVGINRYREKAIHQTLPLSTITTLTRQFLKAQTLQVFNHLILQHEQIVSSIIELPRARVVHFSDYPFGVIKSLGAWGGDFVMATSEVSNKVTRQYFYQKGFQTVFNWKELIL